MLTTAGKRAPVRVVQLPTQEILPNPAQPRKCFEAEALRELAESITRYGVLQPLTVRRVGGEYVLVAGERRLRASRMAGLRQVPCIITELDQEESAAVALVENLHRRDLTFVEEAEGLRSLITLCSLSREEAARRVGKSPSAVANKLRLLNLSGELLRDILEAGLSERHARALLRLPDETRRPAFEAIAREGMSVARTEEYIDGLCRPESPPPKPSPGRTTYVVKDVRLFLNAVNRSLEIMRRGGVDAQCARSDTGDLITLTIRIPKRPGKP